MRLCELLALASFLSIACVDSAVVGGAPDGGASGDAGDGSSGEATASSTSGDSSQGSSTGDPSEDESGGENSGGSSGESDGDSTGSCGCGFFEVGVDESVDGTTVQALVEATSPLTLPWTWTGIEGQPTTTVNLSLELIGSEAVAMGDPCGLDAQCVGVGGPVLVNITTDDGRLDESMMGSIGGTGTYAQIDVTASAFTEFQGTLPESDFIRQPGLSNPPDNAGIGGSWTFEDDAVELSVYVPLLELPPIVLGTSD